MDNRDKWSQLSTETLHSCPYYDFRHDRYRLPSGGDGDYYYIRIPGSTMVVPRRPDGELVLVRQYRYLHRRVSLELPAGGMKAGRSPLETARDELREETGLIAAQWKKLGQFAPCNGLSDELCHVFLAEELSQGQASPEPTEELEAVTIGLDEARRKILSGELWDGMTIAALSLYALLDRGGSE